MAEWSNEAVEEALNAYSDSWRCYYEEDNELCRKRMRAALNAAVVAQFGGDETFRWVTKQVRAKAFEEAIALLRDAFYADSSSLVEAMRNKFLEGK